MDVTFDYVLKNGIGQSPLYYFDDKAKFEGIAMPCNTATIGSAQYKSNKFFIKEFRKIKFTDCA